MAKGPNVTPEVEALITSVYQKHPKWKAPTVCGEVRLLLHKGNPTLPPEWPSLSTVQKVLATVRKNLANPSCEDMLWTMGTLNEFPISPEVIPYVLDAWKLRVARGETFSIREAKWVSRLSGFELQGLIITKEWRLDLIKNLSYVASGYARLERLWEALGFHVFNSNGLDKLVVGIPENVPTCPVCKETWSLFDLLALEGGDVWAKAVQALRARKYRELPNLEGQLSSIKEELPGTDEYAQEIESDWEEYKKEAKNES
jgi:hypothetical protein